MTDWRLNMSSTEQRLRALALANLDLGDRNRKEPLNLTESLADVGVSSIAAVGFMRAVIAEFGVRITPEEFAALPSLEALVHVIDTYPR